MSKSLVLRSLALAVAFVVSGGLAGESAWGGGAGAASVGADIQGTVEVAPTFASKVPPGGVLFVIARSPGVKSGPPVAVARIASPKFPQSFSLGAQQMMMGGEFKGPYEISAKLSKTGNAMTSSGDLLGETENQNAVSAGAKGVKVVLLKAAP